MFPNYTYNDVDSLAAAAAAVSGDLAGIVVSAFKHDAGYHQELPDPAFARQARAICDAEGAALILDDVRAGLRLSLDASWSLLGVRPDLSAWGKAIANGEPLSAILGSEPYREAAASIFVTGSLWYQGAPLAAAIETLELLAEVDAPALLERRGQLFRDGLAEQSTRYGHALRQTGPPQMPTVMFEDDVRNGPARGRPVLYWRGVGYVLPYPQRTGPLWRRVTRHAPGSRRFGARVRVAREGRSPWRLGS